MDTPTSDSKARNHKHSIYMSPEVWEKASRTAARLNMSTSQLLSQLVVETADAIRPNSLLGLRDTFARPLES
jgi:hypothetical protein